MWSGYGPEAIEKSFDVALGMSLHLQGFGLATEA